MQLELEKILGTFHVDCYYEHPLAVERSGGSLKAIGASWTSLRQIYLSTDQYQTIGNSSLFHEMTHQVLGNLYFNGDPDHDQGEGPWTIDHRHMLKDLKVRFDPKACDPIGNQYFTADCTI